jgi:hydroxymethylpyrimidine pyrophosphatase-like HAD family hydrolase
MRNAQVQGRLVRELKIDGGLLDDVACYLADWEGCALGVYDIDRVTGISDGEVSYAGATAAELERHASAFPRPYTVVEHVTRPSYTKTNVRCDLAPERVEALTAGLKSRFGDDLTFVSPMAGGPFIDILPAGWDKGRAVEEIMGLVGLAPDEVAAFGDSENDLAMLSVVGHPVAVANATAEVAASSRWHIGAAADDAVADALADIAAAASTGSMPAFMS